MSPSIRDILQQPPSLEHWRAFCSAIDLLDDASLQLHLPSLLEALAQWPDALRLLPLRWHDETNPRIALARSLWGVYIHVPTGSSILDCTRFYPDGTVLMSCTDQDSPHLSLLEYAYYTVENLNKANPHPLRATYGLKDGHLTMRYPETSGTGRFSNNGVTLIGKDWTEHHQYLPDAERWLDLEADLVEV